MFKTDWVLGGLLSAAALLPTDNPTPFAPIGSKCRLIWKTEIGNASFRTNLLLQGNQLFIGSNGNSFMDRGLIEPSSGVYALDRKTGKKITHFANELFGDMDVNGLLLHNNRLYFGNDNEEFLCTDLDGKIRWRNPTSGDIEHEPTLLKTKQGPAIVYAAESGEVKAVDPEQGNIIWSYYVPEFDGWKPGEDRTVFKVKAWFSNTGHFYTRPLVVDVNSDGTNDLIYRTFDGSLLALNGNTGSKIWSLEEKESLSLGMALVGRGKEKKIVALRNIYADTVRYEIAFFSLQGQRLASRPVSELSWGSGLNAFSVDGDHVLINGRTKTFRVDQSGSVTEINRSIPFQFKSWNNELTTGYRNGNDPLFAEGFIPLKNGKKGVVVMNQCDLGNTDVGFVEILSLEERIVLDRFSLPTCGEMPPVIRDVDLDGDLDLLFAGYDGYLYCYQLPKY